LKRMTREEGVCLVEKYQIKKPSDLSLFLEWIEMTEEEFMKFINLHRDLDIWELNGEDEWNLKDSISNHLNDDGVEKARLEGTLDRREYLQTVSFEDPNKDNEYVLMGRSYMDENDFRAVKG